MILHICIPTITIWCTSIHTVYRKAENLDFYVTCYHETFCLVSFMVYTVIRHVYIYR